MIHLFNSFLVFNNSHTREKRELFNQPCKINRKIFELSSHLIGVRFKLVAHQG